MKNQFINRLIGAAIALLLATSLSSCTGYYGAYEYRFLGGGVPCGQGGGDFVHADTGCILPTPVYAQYSCPPGGYYPQQNCMPGNGQYEDQFEGDYRRSPLVHSGYDSYGNELLTGVSYSGNPYTTTNGRVTAPPIGTQDPRKRLVYVHDVIPDRR